MSPELIDHFKNPRNVGELQPPAVVVEVSNPVCGDILRLSAMVSGGRVREIGYKVCGCAASIGCGSALTEMLLVELRGVTAEEVERAVGGLTNESKHAAALCSDAAAELMKKIPLWNRNT